MGGTVGSLCKKMCGYETEIEKEEYEQIHINLQNVKNQNTFVNEITAKQVDKMKDLTENLAKTEEKLAQQIILRKKLKEYFLNCLSNDKCVPVTSPISIMAIIVYFNLFIGIIFLILDRWA